MEVKEIKQKNYRRFDRQPVPICAWLEFRHDGSTRAMRSLDLSTDGARFATIRPVIQGELIMMRLDVRPGAPAVECKARVCWVQPMADRVRQFGVRFVDLAEDERTEIDQAMVDAANRQLMAAF